MLKQCGSRSVVRTEERIGRNVVKTGVTRGKMVMKMAYAKARKMLVEDAVQMPRQKVITAEPEAKAINAKDGIIVLGLFKVTEKVTTETPVQPASFAIVAGTKNITKN
jgi:hypothetical protein